MSINKTVLLFWVSIFFLISCQEQAHKQQNSTSNSIEESKINSLEIKHAEWFSVDYYKDYKKITLINPWNNSTYWEYLIYKDKVKSMCNDRQCTLSEVNTSAVLSSTLIGIFAKLDIHKHVKFIDQVQYIYNPEIRASYKDEEVKEIGEGTMLNIERVLLGKPSVIFTSGWEQTDPNYQKLLEQNVPVAFSLDWREQTPLARAEWIKFVAAFYNLEDQACDIFDQIEKEYMALTNIAKEIPVKKSIMHGAPWSGTWYIAGGKSYMAQFYKDAHANYLWKNDSSTGSLPLSFEAVFLKGKNADIWFASTQSKTLKGFMNDDPRFLEFKSFKNQKVYSNTILKEGEQAKAFWENGIVNPNWILKDLIAIIHPETLPDHELRFYSKLE